MATVAYLKSYFDEDVDLHPIYRYMDKLYNMQMERVQQISVNHTMKILGGKIGIVFYVDKDVHVMLDQEKIAEDALWDGLKGYITNTSLDPGKVINQYHGLWVVERAFRISKGQLETRPIFHFTERRIEAHICICFIAYKIYKELERVIHETNINLSVDKVLSIAKTITTIQINLPINGEVIHKTLFLTEEQQRISQLFD